MRPENEPRRNPVSTDRGAGCAATPSCPSATRSDSRHNERAIRGAAQTIAGCPEQGAAPSPQRKTNLGEGVAGQQDLQVCFSMRRCGRRSSCSARRYRQRLPACWASQTRTAARAFRHSWPPDALFALSPLLRHQRLCRLRRCLCHRPHDGGVGGRAPSSACGRRLGMQRIEGRLWIDKRAQRSSSFVAQAQKQHKLNGAERSSKPHRRRSHRRGRATGLQLSLGALSASNRPGSAGRGRLLWTLCHRHHLPNCTICQNAEHLISAYELRQRWDPVHDGDGWLLAGCWRKAAAGVSCSMMGEHQA